MFSIGLGPKKQGTAQRREGGPRASRPLSSVGGTGPSCRMQSVRRSAAARQILRRHESGVARQHLGDLLLILQELGGGLEDFRCAALLAAAQPGFGGLLTDRQQR